MPFFADFMDSPEKLYSFIGAAAAVSIPLVVNTCKDFYFDFQKRKTEKNYIVIQILFPDVGKLPGIKVMTQTIPSQTSMSMKPKHRSRCLICRL